MSPSSQLLLLLSLLFNSYPAVNAACWPKQMIEPDCHECNPHITIANCEINNNIHLLFPEGFLAEMISPPTALSHETLDITERTMFNVANDPRIATIPAKFDRGVRLNNIRYFYRYLNNCFEDKYSIRSAKCNDSKVSDQKEIEKIKNSLLSAPGNAKNQIVNTVFSLISNPESRPKNKLFSKSTDGFKGTWSYIFTRQGSYFIAMVIFARHLINNEMYDADLIRWAYLQFQNYRFIGMGAVKYSGPQKEIAGLTMPQRFNQLGLYTSKFYLKNDMKEAPGKAETTDTKKTENGESENDESYEENDEEVEDSNDNSNESDYIKEQVESELRGKNISEYIFSQLNKDYYNKRIFTSTAYLENLVVKAKSICNVIEMPDSAAGCISMAVYLMGVDNDSAKKVYDALFSYNGRSKYGTINYIHQNCAKWHSTDQCNNAIKEYGASDTNLLTIGGALKELYNTVAPQK